MILEWQEIDKLRQDVKTLQRQISRQEIKLSNKPILRVGNIVATDITNPRYALQEIGVDSEKEEAHVKAGLIGSDPGPAQSKSPHSFLIDSGGNKFLLPDSNRVILIRDNGDGTGKQVEVDINGNVTFPPETESKNLVVTEPASQFHGENYPWKTGRLIPGIQLVSTSGVSFFLVFCQGFGEATETSSIEVISTRIDVNHDTAGHIISVDSEILEVLLSNFWRWSGVNWHALDGGPPARYNHTSWSVTGGGDCWIHGGIGAGGVKLKDTWKWTATGFDVGYWTQYADAPFARANLATGLKFGGAYNGAYIFGDTGGTLYHYDWNTDTWTPKAVGFYAGICPFGEFAPGGVHWVDRKIFADVWNILSDKKRVYYIVTNTWETRKLWFRTPNPIPVSHHAYIGPFIFGGKISGNPTSQVLDISGYGSILPNMPIPRYSHAGGYIAGSPAIFFGGIDGIGNVTNTTWTWDGATWLIKTPVTVPDARFGHSLSTGGFMFGGKPTI